MKEIADIGQGLVYRSKPKEEEEYDSKKHLPPDAQTISDRRFKGSIQEYTSYSANIKLTEIPNPVWINHDKAVIRRLQWEQNKVPHQ